MLGCELWCCCTIPLIKYIEDLFIPHKLYETISSFHWYRKKDKNKSSPFSSLQGHSSQAPSCSKHWESLQWRSRFHCWTQTSEPCQRLQWSDKPWMWWRFFHQLQNFQQQSDQSAKKSHHSRKHVKIVIPLIVFNQDNEGGIPNSWV